MLNFVCKRVNIPVIASGGCGAINHFSEVFKQTGASAALAASLFHFGELIKLHINPSAVYINGIAAVAVAFRVDTHHHALAVGDPVELAVEYNKQGADEIVFYDITASYEGRGVMLDVVKRKKSGSNAHIFPPKKSVVNRDGASLPSLSYPSSPAYSIKALVKRCILNHHGSRLSAKPSVEEICVADADAVSYFDLVTSLFYLEYERRGHSQRRLTLFRINPIMSAHFINLGLRTARLPRDQDCRHRRA